MKTWANILLGILEGPEDVVAPVAQRLNEKSKAGECNALRPF